MSDPAMPGWGKRALKIAGIALVVMAVVLVVLYLLAEPLVGYYLKKQVANQSAGLYQLKFDDLQLHPRTRSITLTGLHLSPDTATYHRQKESGQASGTVYDLQSQRITVTRIGLADLLFRNRFHVHTISAMRPVITQWLDESVEEPRNRDSQTGGSLKALRIRKLTIQDASYRYLVQGQGNWPRHEIPQFSLQVQDLRLDLREQEDLTKMLRAAALDLDLHRYTYHSPDSVYRIQLKRLSYSSEKQTLTARDMTVQPDNRVNSSLTKADAHRFLYRLSVPLLHMRGLDMGFAWRTKQLQLDRLLLQHTALQVLEDLTLPASSALALNELYASLSPFLQEVSVRDLRVDEGSFNYLQEKNYATHTLHSLNEASIHLQDLRLDSASLFSPKEHAFADAILVDAKRYTYSPANSPYTLETGNIHLSTRDKSLHVEALHLAGDRGINEALKKTKQAERTLYDITLPSLRLDEMDLLQAVRTSHLNIGKIAVAQPVMEVRTDQLLPKMTESTGMQEMYRQFSGFVNTLQVGEISIADATYRAHSQTTTAQLLHQVQHASLTATGLKIDSVFIFDADAKLPLQEIDLSAGSYYYRMPDNSYTFDLKNLSYSSHKQEFTVGAIAVVPGKQLQPFNNNSRKLFDFSASTLRITGLDLIETLHTRRLEADQLFLRQPDLAVMLDRQVIAAANGQQEAEEGLFDLVDLIAVKTIRLEDGSFTLNEKLKPVVRSHLLEHATATVSGFRLTPDSFANLNDSLPMQELTLQAATYTYQSSDSLYTFKLDSLHYSSLDQELVASTFTVSTDREVNERLKANTPELASRNLIDISSKRSLITGLNLINAYATGQYHMDMLLLFGPEVTILQDHNVPLANDVVPKDTITGGDALAQLGSTFQVDRFEVANGKFDFHILDDTIRVSQTLEHVALAIDQLRLVSLEENDPLNIFDADNVGILVRGYTFYTPDTLYALEVKQIRASMHNRSLTADSLRLRPLYSKEAYATLFTYARDRVELEAPAIDMQGISLRALFNNQQLVAHKMLIRNPKADIYRDNRIGIDPAQRPPTMQSLLREAGFYIRLDTILVDKKDLVNTVVATEGVKPGVFLLQNLRLELYNVTNDTAFIRLNNMVTVNTTAELMGASTLRARFLFQMDHPEDRYTYEGTLEPMDFVPINPLFENLMFIRIKSGRMNNAWFSVEATANRATGQVHFPYNHLTVELLNKKDPEHPGFVLKAGNRLVNLFVIKHNNPSARGKFREGRVDEERDPKRSVYYHMSQSMLDGITTSLMSKFTYRIVSRFMDL